MKQLIQRAAGSTFLRHNVIYFTGATVVSVLNYLYYPVLGRLLEPADFGEVQTIISLFLQVSVFLQVLGLVTIAILKKYEEPSLRNRVLVGVEWLTMSVGFGFFALAVILSPALKDFLNFQSVVPFILLAVTVVLGIPATLGTSYLQGVRRFGLLAWSNIVPAAAKLVLSVGFVWAGLRTTGALLGLALSQVINLVYTTYLSVKYGRPMPRISRRLPDLQLIRPELRNAGYILIASICINVMLSIDIVAVKHYFSPHAAGLYAGIATIARIIFFLTGPLVAVLVASVKLSDSGHNRALLKRSLALTIALGGSALVMFTLFPIQILTLLMGSRYLEYAGQLPGLSLAIFILSVSNLLLFYHLMLRRYRIVAPAAAGLVSMVILLALQHQSIASVVQSLIEGSVILFILILIVSIWRPKDRRV